jgi:hypothetical protein
MISRPEPGSPPEPEGAPTQPSTAVRRPRRRWLRRLLVALVLVALLAVAVRAALPFALERGVPWLAAREAGLPVRIANVDLALLRGEVALEGFVVGRPEDLGSPEGPPPEVALLRWQRLFAALDWRALLDGRVHLREIALDRPVVRIEREPDGRIDPLAGTPLVEPGPEQPEPADGAEEPSEPWPVALDRLALRQLELRLLDADGSTPVELSFEELALGEIGLEGSDVDLGGVTLRGPRLRLRRDFSLPPGRAAEEGATPAQPAAPPGHRLRRVAIENASFTLLTGAEPLDVVLDLEAEDVSLQSGHVFPVRVGLGIEGGKLEAEGRVGTDPVSYEGRVTWSELPVPPLALVAEPELAKWVRSCRADGDLQVALHLAPPAATGKAPGAAGAEAPGATAGERHAAAPGVRLTGRFGVADLALEDPAAAEVALAFKRFEGGIEEVFLPLGDPSATTRIHLERLLLEEPTVRYTHPSRAFDAFGAKPAEAGAEEPPAAAPPAAEPGAAPGPLDVRLGSFELDGGRLRFDDRSVSPPFQSEVQRLQVTLRDVRWPDIAVGAFDVAARLPQKGRLALKGSLAALDDGRVELALENLALPPFNPYASQAAGYRMKRGEASLKTALRVRGNRYEADNRLVLHRLAVDPDSEANFQGQFGMSIDLALSLLRDRKGDIGLPIPVALEGEEVKVGIGSIVRSALTSAVRGALLSPLKALGAAIPSGGGELRVEPLAALPGQPELAPGQEERLAQVAELLSSHAALSLVLRGQAGKADRLALAEALLVERAAAGEELPELESAGWSDRRHMRAMLAARNQNENLERDAEDAALWARYVEATQVPPERFDALARRRAELAAERLRRAAELDPAQVRVENADSRGKPGVVLELAPREAPGEGDVAGPTG